jgi:subtilisin family serine protease
VIVDLEHPALVGRSGRGVRVAVIDSGINASHPHVGGLVEAQALDDLARPSDDSIDRLGHGTAVAAAIHEKAPGAAIHVMKVFHDTLSTTVPALRRALEWAIESGMRVVNLSLGTARPEHGPILVKALKEAAKAGCLVVSARSHEGVAWYPGSLARAIGVELDWSLDRHAMRLDPNPDGGGLARASGYPRPIPGVHPDNNLHGISFAVANVTGLLARVLEERPELRSAAAVAELLEIPAGSALRTSVPVQESPRV